MWGVCKDVGDVAMLGCHFVPLLESKANKVVWDIIGMPFILHLQFINDNCNLDDRNFMKPNVRGTLLKGLGILVSRGLHILISIVLHVNHILMGSSAQLYIHFMNKFD